MKVGVRKETNGLIYVSDNLIYDDIDYTKAPYNFKIMTIENVEDISSEDFTDNLEFSREKYEFRKNKKVLIKKIEELKSKLANTDYQAIKFAEGEMTAVEYERIKNYRKQWRAEINELEESLKK